MQQPRSYRRNHNPRKYWFVDKQIISSVVDDVFSILLEAAKQGNPVIYQQAEARRKDSLKREAEKLRNMAEFGKQKAEPFSKQEQWEGYTGS